MNLKSFKKQTGKAKKNKFVVGKLAKSYVSLFLILVLCMTSVFAWFAQRKAASITAQNMEFQSASSLRINKEQNASTVVTIDQCVLDEASSTDGRNIYFPLDKSFTTNADDMYFREGNTGDRNVRYVYKDFSLKGSSGNTPVYIKSYEVKVEEADTPHDPGVNATYHDHLEINYSSNGKPSSQKLPPDHCPIRLAFIADSGQRPVVIDPSAQVVDYVDNTINAVSLIDENGVPTTVDTFNNNNNWNSFASYYYGNSPLFVIPGGQELNVTLVVWLEGTLEDSDKYIGKKISVDIDIESNFPEMETITFYDDSQPDNSDGHAHWVSDQVSKQVNNVVVKKDPIVACSYEDPYSDVTPKRWKTVIMTKSSSDNYTWTCKIPKKVVTKISFYRLDPFNGTDQGTIYNAWYTHPDVSNWRNSSIDSSWFTKGDLQITRQFTDTNGNKYNSLVYRAVHGNGYSETTDPAKRLSPCIGYWDTVDSGGSVTPTESGGGGGSSATTYSVNVVVETKGWVGGNVGGGSRLHFTTSSGGDYAYTTYTNTTHFEQTFTLNDGDEITGFYLLHTGGAKTYLRVNSIFTVTRNAEVIYTQQNDDTLTPNLTS